MAELGLQGVQVAASDMQSDGHSTMLSRTGKEPPATRGLNVGSVVVVREVEKSLVTGPRQFVDFMLLILTGF